jgi:hypothetical protein
MGFVDDVTGFFKWTADPGGIFKDENKTDPMNARYTDGGYLSSQYQDSAIKTQERETPQAQRTRLGQAAQLDPSQQAQFRNQQMAQANRLGAIASGQQQGAGELAAQRQANRSIAQQQAMARMGRGQAGAGRMAARNVADIGTSAAGQSQVAALQDQQAANAQLGSVLAQGREADIGMAGQNAQFQQQQMLQQGGMDQQRMLANVDAQLRARGMNDQARLAYLQQLSQMNAAELDARMRQEATAAGIPSQSSQMMQAAGPIIGAIAMSDKRAKKNIRDGGSDVDAMLDELKAVTYEYRKGAPKEYVGDLGDGRRIAGFIAQDLSKSKAGRAIVSETADGKQVVDVRGGLFAAIAASARLNERVRALESKKE